MKMFRARFNKIEEFEVIKETEKQVVYVNGYGKEEREAKITDWQSWHKTKEDAINHMVGKKQAKIEGHYSQIKSLNEEIEKIILL